MKILLFFITLLVSISAFSQEKKVKIFPFKSAIVEYKYEASFAGTHIKYIDDYGYKQVDIIKKELHLGGINEKLYETIILIGEKAYTINYQDSTVAVGRNSTYAYYLANQDKESTVVSEAILRAAYSSSQSGTETYLKKECKRWQSGKSTMLSWNGLELKSEVNFMTMMVEKAVKLKVDKKIPESVFDIPEGFRYISSDAYQGLSGLNLIFDETTTTPINEDQHIEVSFNTNSLGGTDNFSYITTTSEIVVTNGVNDYNKIDNHLIKSQATQMKGTMTALEKASTLIFLTNEGLSGKMQILEINQNNYLLRYVLFNNDGLIIEYSEGVAGILENDFKIYIDDNKLNVTPVGKAKCFVLGM